ncbi:PREDICTED: uncharacterized protein LOC106302551 [Brassica oleracea var. oleracea]|uniref:uncharacterized protein LOC106302551 n=1 Tax=Brassica oleracea var. oleracea TaxID=109376 RepID=UPI0006A6B6C9|nr:PREDICTED: uncharacterized protein LOC106302551 [Brassica oleracea var. oleracea]
MAAKALLKSGLRKAIGSGYNTRVWDESWLPTSPPRPPTGVWASKTVPKIKHFMWQALTNCVPVCSRLADLHCHPDRTCPRCGQHEETINHMLFECHMATQTWSLAALPTDPGEFPSSSIYGNFDFVLNRIHKRHSTKECKARIPWILWFLWKARNEKVFSNKDISPLEVLQSAVSETI